MLKHALGREGKLNQIINLMHPEAFLYIEGIMTTVLFSALLSGFAWFLTEIAIEHLESILGKETGKTKPGPVNLPVSANLAAREALGQKEPVIKQTINGQSAYIDAIVQIVNPEPIRDEPLPVTDKEPVVAFDQLSVTAIVKEPLSKDAQLAVPEVLEVVTTNTEAQSIHLAVTKECANCSKPFIPKRNDAIYCEPKCKHQAFRKKQEKEVAA